MNQGCVKCGGKVRVGILLEMYEEGVHQYPVTPKYVATLQATMGLFHTPLSLQSYSSHVVMCITH